MEVDLQYIDEVDPELAIKIKNAIHFRDSDFGKEVAGEIDLLETTSEKTTVDYLCMNEVDKAKTSAALAAACTHIRGVLWESVLQEGRNITALKEGEDYA